MNEAIVVDTFVRRRAKSETMHEKRTRMIFHGWSPIIKYNILMCITESPAERLCYIKYLHKNSWNISVSMTRRISNIFTNTISFRNIRMHFHIIWLDVKTYFTFYHKSLSTLCIMYVVECIYRLHVLLHFLQGTKKKNSVSLHVVGR